MKILVINAGSSSVKFTLCETEGEVMLAHGLIERINSPNTRMRFSNTRGYKYDKDIAVNSCEAAISQARLALLDKNTGALSTLAQIQGIGHRVVHGGSAISGAVRVTPAVKRTIMDCYSLAPLHNPPNYEGIAACESLFPDVPMVAVFDTAFHQTMPPAAYSYAIPHEMAAKNRIRRYGFHGASHHYVALKAAQILGRAFEDLKLITAHLGNGCSITAIARGRVEDTSMGLTPLEGLVMGTRCGDMDPAVVMFLQRLGHSLDAVDKLLNNNSGLLGLAGIGSNDMRDIMNAVDDGNAQAKLALDVFVYRLTKYVGAYAAVLNGFDALIFTAGIGENAPRLRAAVCERLTFLGIVLDPERNKANATIISRDGARPAVMVVPTNEELMIARETARILMS